MAKHKIRGKVWEVVYVPNLKMDGWCDHPETKGKRIQIAQRTKGQRRLVVLIHEAIHAGLWDLDESVVEQLAEDIGRLVWKEMKLNERDRK